MANEPHKNAKPEDAMLQVCAPAWQHIHSVASFFGTPS